MQGRNSTLTFKTCCGCKEEKKLSEYSVRVLSKDGLQSKCKDCMKAYLRDYNKTYRKSAQEKDGNGAGSKLYTIYYGMLDRCNNVNNVNYKHYGGRGISICGKWSNFENFKEDMEEGWEDGMSIERVDVNGDYCPENCIWIPLPDQALNKTNTVYITKPDGTQISLIDLSDQTGLTREFLNARWKRFGDSYEEIIQPKMISEFSKIPSAFKHYVWLNKDLKLCDYRDWLNKNCPDLKIRDQYIIQLASDFRCGRKTFNLEVV